MFVVVHEEEAVGVGGEKAEIEVGVADGSADVEAQVACVEVLIERGDQGLIAGLAGKWDLLEVQREAAIAGVGGEKPVGELDEMGAGIVAVRKSAMESEKAAWRRRSC